MTKAAYREYLRSEHWKKTRSRIVSRDGGKCVKCGSKMGIQVHHKTYVNLGHEPDEDLETLCEWCHPIEHDIKPPNQNKHRKKISARQRYQKKHAHFLEWSKTHVIEHRPIDEVKKREKFQRWLAKSNQQREDQLAKLNRRSGKRIERELAEMDSQFEAAIRE